MEKKSEYLELLKIVLTDYHPEPCAEYLPLGRLKESWKTRLLRPLDLLLRQRNFAVTKLRYSDPEKRKNGCDWPANAYTMIGIRRLDHLEYCIRKLVEQQTAGDFLEAGVWRGGAVIFMQAVLNTLGEKGRKIFGADSFEGLPAPNPVMYPADGRNKLHLEKILQASQEEVARNIRRFFPEENGIHLLKGLFRDMLPTVPSGKLALLRIDADMYESTSDALNHLYPALNPGGFVIIDDYNAFPECKKAVEDFRDHRKITTPISLIDREAVFWQKESPF
jgi:hypothetical protein